MALQRRLGLVALMLRALGENLGRHVVQEVGVQVKRLRIASRPRRRSACVKRAGVLPPVPGLLAGERNHRVQEHQPTRRSLLADRDCGERTHRLGCDHEIPLASGCGHRQADLRGQTGVRVLTGKVEVDH